MMKKITEFLYENNIKKINEIIDEVNALRTNAYTKTEVDSAISSKADKSSIGNEAGKIPIYSEEGHLILPSGIELF